MSATLLDHTDSPGLVSYAFIALDHDEHSVKHIVIDSHEGTLRAGGACIVQRQPSRHGVPVTPTRDQH